MALSPVSLLLLRRIAITSKTPKPQLFLLPLKPYSTSTATSSPDPPKPASLSARMSFVFDQIDAIERERTQKDETLQRIRAWRQSRDPQTAPEASTVQNTETVSRQDEKLESWSGLVSHSGSDLSQGSSFELEEKKKTRRREVEVVHPWPEWIELMERLVQQNYFDHRRRDEDKMLQDSGFDVSGLGNDEDGKDVEIDFNDYRTVQLACLNFGKDRFDIFRSLSRHDIQNLVGYGCPSADKKVVFSSKLLRKHVHLDEGDVCSNCSLRSSCERAYLVTNKEDEARTIDVMRVLLAYGFDPINGSVSNKSLLKQKSVKSVVRKLLHQVVKLSSVPIDPNLPPPIIRKPPPKVKQPPPPPKKRVGRDDIEMKKGDWLCPKCDFMNFAKNTVCLQCDAKRPKRQLLPGEWECPECNFLNYRRNMTCFHCDCKRPPDEFMESKMDERKRDHRKLEKNFSHTEVSNAWNFDFDDNESDGADAEAFEYADAPAVADSPPQGSRTQDGNFKGQDDNLNRANRSAGVHDREISDRAQSQLGFDDFDDEDDIESYELDTQNGNPLWKGSQNNFSELEDSGSEDVHDSGHNFHNRLKSRPSSSGKAPKHMSKRAAFSGSEDAALGSGSDEEFGVHPKWKSSHVTDTKHRNTGKGPSRGLSFGSDEENGLDSDIDEDFASIRRKSSGPGERKMPTHKRDDNFRSHNDYDFVRDGKVRSEGRMGNRRSKWDEEPGLDSDIDDDSDEDFGSSRRKRSGSRGKRMSAHTRDDNFRGQDLDGFLRDAARRSRGGMGDRRNSWDDSFERSSSGSRWKNRRFQGSNRPSRRMDEKHDDLKNFRGRNREGSRNWHRGNPHENNMDGDRHFGEFKNSRRVIER